MVNRRCDRHAKDLKKKMRGRMTPLMVSVFDTGMIMSKKLTKITPFFGHF